MIDTSLVTGETLPREVRIDYEVFAGTLNQSAPLRIRVAKASEDSLLADIVRLMEKAEQGQARYVKIADRAARLYTPVVHFLAVSAFVFWWGFIGLAWQDSLLIAVTVLIITCPCALGLAVPVVQILASSALMKRGILVKSGDALERLAAIDTVLFDKTGTLTRGQPQLIGEYDDSVLQVAASLAQHSAHPLSKAVCQAYGGGLFSVTGVQDYPGLGLEGDVNGQHVKLGSRSWCMGDIGQNGVASDEASMEICMNVDGHGVQIFKFSDQLREDAVDTVLALRNRKLETILLSGDRQNVVENVAKDLSMDHFYAQYTPVEKCNILDGLKQDGHTVLMVGDGLNDAPVLSAANVSMAPGTAVDMAQNAADIIFMGDDLSPVLLSYKLARRTQNLVKQNFVLAILYNCIAVPLAFSGLVTPMIAALAMSGSSLLVIANSYRLRLGL